MSGMAMRAPRPSVTRRSALALIAAAALPQGLPTPAAAQLGPAPVALPPGLRFRDVAVDTSRLARLGDPAAADLVATDLTRSLREVFADLLAPSRAAGGATLSARISSLFLADYAGTRSYNGRDGGGNNDDLEGVGIVSSGGRVLAEVPILSVLDAGYSGAWYEPDIDARRVASICHHFAYWLRREMGV